VIKYFWKSFFLPDRFFYAGFAIAITFVLGHFFVAFGIAAKLMLLVFISLILFDSFILYRKKNGLNISRFLPERFSNGDKNTVKITVENKTIHKLKIKIIDEAPEQFQKRDIIFFSELQRGELINYDYDLVPVKRGNYIFGNVNVFASSAIGLLERRFLFDSSQQVAVYPSFHNLKKLEMLSFAHMQLKLGIKPIRRTGNNKEFDQTRLYFVGDETKHLNWKATARLNRLMVNQYRDEREQDIYCIIDMGRNMKMPFEGMTLMDYAINSTLAISKVVLKNDDKIGLITYSDKPHSIIPSGNRNNQLHLMMEALFKQQTKFKESSLEPIYELVKRKVTQRSLLLIFTNFESIQSVVRQMDILKRLRRNHLVVLIFFENMELRKVINQKANQVESIYLKTIVEKLVSEKKMLANELRNIGIHSVLATPENLTIDTINKYLEIKARGLL
jgi:uncharacterized protein (DUF58 family)